MMSRSFLWNQVENTGPFIAGMVHQKTISSNPDLSEIPYHNTAVGVIHHEYRLIHTGASFISVKFTNFDFDPGCEMVIDDKNFNHVHHMYGKGRQQMGSFWCHHVEGDELVLTVKCQNAGEKADFLVEEYVAGIPGLITGDITGTVRNRQLKETKEEDSRHLGVCGANDKVDAKCYEYSHPLVYNKSQSVARILIDGKGICTGFLIGPDHLLTSAKCIQNEAQALSADVQFLFESTTCNGSEIPFTQMYEATALLAHSVTDDYALLHLDGRPGDSFGYLVLDSTLPAVDDPIFIPQQPLGRDKEIALFDSTDSTDSEGRCTIVTNGSGANDSTCSAGASFTDIGYSCDTEPGSLGAPVISATTGHVVGMHHCGNFGGNSCGGNFGIPAAAIYTVMETFLASSMPSDGPSFVPSDSPSLSPTAPSVSASPSEMMSYFPSDMPSLVPSAIPSFSSQVAGGNVPLGNLQNDNAPGNGGGNIPKRTSLNKNKQTDPLASENSPQAAPQFAPTTTTSQKLGSGSFSQQHGFFVMSCVATIAILIG